MLYKPGLDNKFITSLPLPALEQGLQVRRAAVRHMDHGMLALQSELEHTHRRADFYRDLVKQCEMHSQFIEKIMVAHKGYATENSAQYELLKRHFDATSLVGTDFEEYCNSDLPSSDEGSTTAADLSFELPVSEHGSEGHGSQDGDVSPEKHDLNVKDNGDY